VQMVVAVLMLLGFGFLSGLRYLTGGWGRTD
jgi:hypothetical protein